MAGTSRRTRKDATATKPLSYELLNKLTVPALRKHAKREGISSKVTKKADLVRCICAARNLPHPEDQDREGILLSQASAPPFSSLRDANKATVGTNDAALVNPQLSSSDLNPPNFRRNRLDTRRVPPPPVSQEASLTPPRNFFNLPVSPNTPVLENTTDNVPADSISIEQTIAMLATFRANNDTLEEHVKQLCLAASSVLSKATSLRQALSVEMVRGARARLFLTHFQAEAPSFDHKDVFVPDQDIFILQNKATGAMSEIDAQEADIPQVAEALCDATNIRTVQEAILRLKEDKVAGKHKQKSKQPDSGARVGGKGKKVVSESAIKRKDRREAKELDTRQEESMVNLSQNNNFQGSTGKASKNVLNVDESVASGSTEVAFLSSVETDTRAQQTVDGKHPQITTNRRKMSTNPVQRHPKKPPPTDTPMTDTLAMHKSPTNKPQSRPRLSSFLKQFTVPGGKAFGMKPRALAAPSQIDGQANTQSVGSGTRINNPPSSTSLFRKPSSTSISQERSVMDNQKNSAPAAPAPSKFGAPPVVPAQGVLHASKNTHLTDDSAAPAGSNLTSTNVGEERAPEEAPRGTQANPRRSLRRPGLVTMMDLFAENGPVVGAGTSSRTNDDDVVVSVRPIVSASAQDTQEPALVSPLEPDSDLSTEEDSDEELSIY